MKSNFNILPQVFNYKELEIKTWIEASHFTVFVTN